MKRRQSSPKRPRLSEADMRLVTSDLEAAWLTPEEQQPERPELFQDVATETELLQEVGALGLAFTATLRTRSALRRTA